jgi:hypothetical protein
MIIKLFNKEYVLKHRDDVSGYFEYVGTNFVLHLLSLNNGYYLFRISTEDWKYYIGEQIQLTISDNTDITSLIDFTKYIEFSIRFNLNLVDEKYGIMI